MNYFDDDTLAWMRQLLPATLPQQATFYTPSHIPDEGGGAEVTWTQVAEAVPCRLDRLRTETDRWVLLDDSLANKARYRLVTVHDAPLTAESRVVVDDVAYRVLNIHTAHGAKLVIHALVQVE